MSTQDFEQLRLMYNGRLSTKEANVLKQKIAEDSTLREEANDFWALMHQIKAIDPTRKKISEILAKNALPTHQAGRVRKIVSLARLSSAATVLLVIGVSVFLALNEPPIELSLSEEPSIASNLQKSGSSRLSKGEMDFYQEKYSSSAQYFYEAYKANPQEIIFLYNYGVACYKSKDWVAAQNAFKAVAQSNYEYNESAELYWAISLLMGKKEEEGKLVLESIANSPQHHKKEIAKKLLLKMKKK